MLAKSGLRPALFYLSTITMQITCEFPDNVLPIGTRVFIPRPAINSVQEDEIIGYHCTMVNIDGEPYVYPTDYRLNTVNLDRGNDEDGWKADEFFLTYADAKNHAVEYSVVASPEEWLTAIGLSGTGTEERNQFDEDSELGTCCAIISHIRDILYEVCLTGTITGVQKKKLITAITSHQAPDNTPVLDKILKQLDIEWK